MPDELGAEGGVAVASAAVEDAQPAEQPTAGESGARELTQADVNRGMDAFLRGTLGDESALTSKPAEADATGDSAPQGDVEAGGNPPRGPDGKFLPRRGAAEAVRTAEERVADLERQLAERTPEKIREQLRAEDATAALSAQQRNEAAVFEAACRMADTDPRLVEAVPGDPKGRNLYQWREDRKDLIGQYPEAEAHFRAEADGRASAEVAGFKADQRREIAAIAAEVGLDDARWKAPGTTWGSMTRDAIGAATAPLQERITRLERELHDARTSGLGAVRVPAGAGRSSAGAPTRTMNAWLRGD